MQSPNDSRPSAGRLLIGRASGTIGGGKYRVFASLGRGGMADVQLAAAQGPKGFNKLVVVKRLRPLLAADDVAVTMFLDEARLDARLNHPNVIHTYEFGEEHGGYFIVMEHLDGQSLHEVLHALRRAQKTAPPGVWAAIAAEALAGLHYAHELTDYDGTPLHVVHRDVSPQNIVVTYDGRVKVVDFGIAKATLNVNKTESQIIKGKLAYMAPEQANPPSGRPLDRRVDVFAMGIVLWECLSQRRLVTGDARAAMSKIVDMEFRPPSELNPEVPPELDAITQKALERRPDDRYPTALAMREAIVQYQRARGEFIGPAEIGALVTDLFRDERDDLRRQIRVQMAELGESSGDGSGSGSGPRAPAVGAAAKVASSDPSATTAAAPAPSAPLVESLGSLRAVRTKVRDASPSPSPTGPVARRARAGLALVAIGGVAIALAAIAILRAAGPSAASRTPTSVRLAVRASPADAVLTLDGARVGNPFDGAFPRDLADHRLDARREGYVPASKVVRFDHGDVTYDVALDKEAPPAPPSAAPASPAPSAAPAPAPSASAAPRSPPSPSSPSARPRPPRPAAPMQPNLDDDPWK